MNTRNTQLMAAYLDDSLSRAEYTEFLNALRHDRNLTDEFLEQVRLRRELDFVFRQDPDMNRTG